MTIFIRKARAGNGPYGLSWPTDGAVVPVEDDELGRHLLLIEGFSEATPPAEHPVTEPAPDPAAATKPVKARQQRTKVEE